MLKKLLGFLFINISAWAQTYQADSIIIRKVYSEALANSPTYEWLRQLTKQIGPRLSGSKGAEQAVIWSKKLMEQQGFDRVYLQEVKVPHWVRGTPEVAHIRVNQQRIPVPVVAAGGSVATPSAGLEAQVVEVYSFKELQALGPTIVKGKIVFFNRVMDPTQINLMDAYFDVVGIRTNGATEAAKVGAIGVIVRSPAPIHDDHPHTGMMTYGMGVPLIPLALISTNGADLLSQSLKTHPTLKFYFKQSCESLTDVVSYNVIGEVKGAEKPEEIILVGGHLDSWDLAEGAHDDGVGCVASIEVLRLLKKLGIKPKRTIRVVLFMNEENGFRGAVRYADYAKEYNEKHIVALESDTGGGLPRGFGLTGTKEQEAQILRWKPLLAPYGLYDIGKGLGGADIGPLAPSGTVLVGYKPDLSRYFDLHHTRLDVLEMVNPRELALGAASMAAMVYLLDTYGLAAK